MCILLMIGFHLENELLSRAPNCTIWAYDYSVQTFGPQLEDTNRDRAHFTQVGVAGKTDMSDPPFYSVEDLMRSNGHEYM